MKKILSILICLSSLTFTYAVVPLSSPQVGTSPVNGRVLQTNGATSTWVATTTLGFPTLSSFSATIPIRYNSGTGVISTDLSTSTINVWTALNTFNGGAVINNATATSFGFTSATGTSMFSTQGTHTNLAWTNATGTAFSFTNGTTSVLSFTSATGTNLSATNLNGTSFTYTNGTTTNFGFTNLTNTSILGSFLATDLQGKVIATTSPSGGTYTGTYPIIVTGSVISTGFSTSTINVFSAKQTFANASSTSFTGDTTYWTFATGTNTFSTNLSGTNVYPNITGGSFVATDLNGKLIATTSPAGGSLSGGNNGFVTRWTGATTVSTGVIYDNATVAGVNATSSTVDFNVRGTSANATAFQVASSTNANMFSVDKNATVNQATTTATTTPTNGVNRAINTIGGVDMEVRTTTLSKKMIQQQALWGEGQQVWYTPGIVAAGLWQNTVAGGNLGTIALVEPTVTSNAISSMRRTTAASVITTQNQQVGIRSGTIFFRGQGGTTLGGQGGFFFHARVGLNTWTNKNDLFVGLSSCTTACVTGTTTMTNLANTVGFGVERLNQNLVFLSNDASGVISTTTITGAPALATNNVYDFYLYQPPNGVTLFWQVNNASTTATIASGSTNTNLPATTTLMSANAYMGNAGNIVAGNATIAIMKMYIETER